MMTTKLFLRNLATATLCASSVMVANIQAAYTVNGVPALVSADAEDQTLLDPSVAFPQDMEDWLDNPTQYTWNPVNVRAGNHPDRGDEDPSVPDVVYVFENAADAEAFSDGTAPYPDYIPDTAVGYIHWALDNRSGLFPGIMAITDDYGFKTNNCLMSSGTDIPAVELDSKYNPTLDENGDYIFIEGSTFTKTCSNYRGSGKRFKVVLLQADKNFDLVFNTTKKDLKYTKYDSDLIVNGKGEPIDADLDGETPDYLSEDIYRTYRYIMKWGNGTATDVATVADDGATVVERDGARLSGFGVQVGSYDTTTSTLTAFADSNPEDGILEEGIGYELRLCIGDAYFNELSGQSQPGTSDCDPGYTELWLENEYATFSPAMFSLTTDKRSTPVGGFWDKNPAGVFAPQVQHDTLIDAGDGPYVANVDSFGNPYDPWPSAGQTGQTTSNYYDFLSSQASAIAGDLQGNYFGYMMNFGVISEGDVGTLPWGIYIDEDGDPASEGSLHAWWDGENFRWGIAPNFEGPAGSDDWKTDPDAWRILTAEELEYIASRPLDEDQVLDPPRFEVGVADDLGGLNVDTFIKLQAQSYLDGDMTKENPDRVAFEPDKHPQIAIRMTFDPIVDADGPWVDNPPPQEGEDTPEEPGPEEPPPEELPPEEDDCEGWWCDYGDSDGSGGCSVGGSGSALDPTLPLLVLAGLAGLGLRRRIPMS